VGTPIAGGTASVFDTATNTVTATIPVGGPVTSVDVLPNGRQAYVTDQKNGTVTILDTAR
jgi:DNA-binding beta-propeller fold protein YncE